jgi:hypothetical protein
MPKSRNDSIWRAAPDREDLVPHSVLRTRSFWRTLYRLTLDEEGVPEHYEWSVERHHFDFWSGFFVSVHSGPRESLLLIDRQEAARLDECVTMPHFFRWTEIKSIARYFESENDAPTHPSVTALLLAPFLAISRAEEAAVRPELASLLALLDLLEPDEIAEIVDRRCVPDSTWVETPDVGWSLRWVKEDSEPTPAFSPIYSERVAGAAFGPRLLDLLRLASSPPGG